MYKVFFKRLFDVIISFCGLVILIPFFLIIAIIIKIDSKGPVFFFQQRVGKDLVFFNIFKFRTMYDVVRKNKEEVFSNNKDITAFGYYLRRYKIDEIPQLINVLKGDLSLIGPRPLLPDVLEELENKSRKRFSILPGITGLAQVHGNIYISRDKRIEYDIDYVNNISFLLDVKILIKTISVVLLGEDKFIDKKK